MSVISGGTSASVRIVAALPAARAAGAIDAADADRPRPARARARWCARAPSPAQELLVLPRTERVKWVRGRARSGAELTRRGRRCEPFGGDRGRRPAALPAGHAGLADPLAGARARRRTARAAAARRRRDAPAGRRSTRAATDRRSISTPRSAPPPRSTLELGRPRRLRPAAARASAAPLEVEPDLAAWPTAHARLALVEGGPGTRAPGLDARRALGPVLYVAATARAGCRPGCAGAGVRAAIVVVPKALATQPRSRAELRGRRLRRASSSRAGRRPQEARGVSTETQVAVLGRPARTRGRAARVAAARASAR